MFEALLAEWHITPDYIVANWTEELLNLMVEKLIERKKQEAVAVQEHRSPGHMTGGGDQIVSDKALFNQLGSKMKVIKAS